MATKLGQGNVFTGICDSVNRGGVLSQHALQVVSQHALQQGGLPGPGGACSQGVVAFCYGLLLWSSVMPFCYGLLIVGGLLVWPSGEKP